MGKLTLHIDIETFSSYNLTKVGVYKYVECPEFKVLLFAYKYGDEPVEVVDLACGEIIPERVMDALVDDNVIKQAFNANFEITCLEKYLGIKLKVNQWRCTAMESAYFGLPLSLDGVAKCLGLDVQKQNGKSLISYFSMPEKVGGCNDYKTRNMPQDNLEKWQQFKEYCKNDVLVEKAIHDKIGCFTIPESEYILWQLDQEINYRGIMVNKTLIENAIEISNNHEEMLKTRLKGITDIENPKSVSQLKQWFNEVRNIKVDDLSKETVARMLEEYKAAQEKNRYNPIFKSRRLQGIIDKRLNQVVTVLEIRQELSKTSVKKYEAMKRSLCEDSRIRGLLQFYGANRTGRWAGRLVQVHNLPQNKIEDLQRARTLVESGDYETIESLYESTPEILSQLIRTAFVPSPNCRLIIADFNSVEARILAWLSGEKWRIDMFNKGKKLYEMSASRMFGVPVESITKDSPIRQRGKIAELALGYQGGKGALIAMGALKLGIKEDDLSSIVAVWRCANKSIVNLWSTIEKAAINAVKYGVPVDIQYGIRFIYEKGILFVQLPSGRKLCYVRPRIDIDTGYGKYVLSYEGLDQTTKHWKRLTTYGGKLTENIVQGIARDCLANALLQLDKHNYKSIIHIHDEVVLDVHYGIGSLQEVTDIMGQDISWAKGLILRAEGFESDYYRK